MSKNIEMITGKVILKESRCGKAVVDMVDGVWLLGGSVIGGW